MSKYLSDYDKSIHNNPDAQAWAKFFIYTMKEQGWKIEHIDEGLMLGWFANAMMAMHDHVKREWVGLTDQEMRELEKQFNAERVRTSDEEYLVIYPADYWQWQRAIEAKLKEKNT